MTIDVDAISNIVTDHLTLEAMAEGVRELSAEDLVELAVQVAIAEALQELAYILRERTGLR